MNWLRWFTPPKDTQREARKLLRPLLDMGEDEIRTVIRAYVKEHGTQALTRLLRLLNEILRET